MFVCGRWPVLAASWHPFGHFEAGRGYMVSAQVPDTQWTVDVFGSKVPSASSNVHCGIDNRSVQSEAIDIYGLSLVLWSPARFFILVTCWYSSFPSCHRCQLDF